MKTETTIRLVDNLSDTYQFSLKTEEGIRSILLNKEEVLWMANAVENFERMSKIVDECAVSCER